MQLSLRRPDLRAADVVQAHDNGPMMYDNGPMMQEAACAVRVAVGNNQEIVARAASIDHNGPSPFGSFQIDSAVSLPLTKFS